MSGTMDPTARGDLEAELMRRWYERHRETWWDRVRPSADRKGLHADEFALRLMNEAKRIAGLTDARLCAEYSPVLVHLQKVGGGTFWLRSCDLPAEMPANWVRI